MKVAPQQAKTMKFDSSKITNTNPVNFYIKVSSYDKSSIHQISVKTFCYPVSLAIGYNLASASEDLFPVSETEFVSMLIARPNELDPVHLPLPQRLTFDTGSPACNSVSLSIETTEPTDEYLLDPEWYY
jgi:hypothetical protein